MPRSVRFDNGKALVPLGLIAERWIRDYWQLASGPRMPRQIHQNRELGFGTALERTMTKCHSQYGVFESLMRNEARSKDQTSLLQLLFDDVVTTALKGPIHYIQDDGRNPVFTYVATHAGRFYRTRINHRTLRSPRLSRRTLARTQPHRPLARGQLDSRVGQTLRTL